MTTELDHDAVPTPADLDEAWQVVRRHLTTTPLVTLDGGDDLAPVLLKRDSLQPTGSFKVRGALAAIAACAAAGRPVVTASAGNHGLGVAYAATRLGVDATVVVPRTASASKVEALRRYAVTLVLAGDSYDEAEAAAIDRARSGSRFISAYADRHVIAGQSTLLREVLDMVDGPLTLVVPVGGGGLAAGSELVARALAARDAGAEVRVVGVEAAASLAVSAAVAAGRVVPVPVGPTLADGLAGNIEPGCVTPHLLAATGTQLVAVPEQAISAAIGELWRAGLVVEGSAAVGLAALREGLVPRDRTVVLAVTGRNITAAQFAAAIGA
jgi:threonine dehydratase